MKNGFVKVAVATPCVRVADTSYNVEQLIRIAKDAAGADAKVIVFPELSITGYTCGDLFHFNALIDSAKIALVRRAPLFYARLR